MKNNLYSIESSKIILSLDNKNYILFFFKSKFVLVQIFSNVYLNKFFNNFYYLNKKNLLNLKKLNFFFFSWNNYIAKRLKIRHRVSWLKLYRKKYYLVRINYGFNLKVIYFLFNSFIRKRRRYKTYSLLALWNLSLNSLHRIGRSITTNLKFDKYTLRGYRFAQQKCIKKTGKISKWMDFKVKLL